MKAERRAEDRREGGREGRREGGREGREGGRGGVYLSRVPAKMYFPFGENFTNDTGGFSSSD